MTGVAQWCECVLVVLQYHGPSSSSHPPTTALLPFPYLYFLHTPSRKLLILAQRPEYNLITTILFVTLSKNLFSPPPTSRHRLSSPGVESGHGQAGAGRISAPRHAKPIWSLSKADLSLGCFSLSSVSARLLRRPGVVLSGS